MLMIFCLGLGCITELSAQGWMQWRGPSMNDHDDDQFAGGMVEQTNIVWG